MFFTRLFKEKQLVLAENKRLCDRLIAMTTENAQLRQEKVKHAQQMVVLLNCLERDKRLNLRLTQENAKLHKLLAIAENHLNPEVA